MNDIPSRNLALELVRVTEAAALSAGRFMGRGQKEAADKAKAKAEEEESSEAERQKSEEQKKADDAMAKMRIQLKEEQKAREELEKRMKAQEESAKGGDEKPPSPDECFTYLANAVIEENVQVEQAAKNAILNGLSSVEVDDVIRKIKEYQNQILIYSTLLFVHPEANSQDFTLFSISLITIAS